MDSILRILSEKDTCWNCGKLIDWKNEKCWLILNKPVYHQNCYGVE